MTRSVPPGRTVRAHHLYSPAKFGRVVLRDEFLYAGATVTDGSRLHPMTVPRRRRRPDRRTARYLLLFVTGALVLNALVGERGLLATLTANRLHAELSDRITGLPAGQRVASERRHGGCARSRPPSRKSPAATSASFREGERLFILSDDPLPSCDATGHKHPAGETDHPSDHDVERVV